MANYTVKGRLYAVGNIVTVGQNAMQKRDIVLEVVENPQYPDYLTFDLIKDNVNLVNGLQLGQEIEVHFNLRGRAYQDKQTHQTKFMNNLGAWKIVPAGAPQYQAPPAPQYYQQAPPPAPAPAYAQPPQPQYQQQAPAPQYQQAPPQYAQPAPQPAPQYQQAPAPVAFNRDPDSDLPF